MVHPLDRRPRRILRPAGQRVDDRRHQIRKGCRRKHVQGEIRRIVPACRCNVELLERRERLQGDPHLEFRTLRRSGLGAFLRQRHPRQRNRLRRRSAECSAPLRSARPDARSSLPAGQPAFRRRGRRPHRRRYALGNGRAVVQPEPPRLQACLAGSARGLHVVPGSYQAARKHQQRTRIAEFGTER